MEITKWIHSKEAKMLSDDAKEKAWKDFKIRYPFADARKFVAEADFIDKTHVPADINFKAGPGFWQSASLSNPKYWSDEMKRHLESTNTPLGFHVSSPQKQFDLTCQSQRIQSVLAMPGDPTFNQKDNEYDEVSFQRICAEFGINPSSDFRFKFGQNHGLGYVNIFYFLG